LELSRRPIGVGTKRTSRRLRRRTREERGERGEALRLYHYGESDPRPGADESGEDRSPQATSPQMLNWEGPEIRITVGRSENCEVRILGETVSRLHCEIERIGGGYYLRDRSRNGTWVNGTRVNECQLQNGDWIRVGEDYLRVDFVSYEKATDRLVTRRTVDPTSGLHPFVEYVPPRERGGPQPSPDSSDHALLGGVLPGFGGESPEGESERTSQWKAGFVLPPQMVVRGLEAGVTLQFWDSRITFGRWKATEVALIGEKISRIHAALIREESAYVLVDLESTNGTFVNEQRITRCVLQSGDRVRMGSYQALVRLDQGDCLLHFQRVSP